MLDHEISMNNSDNSVPAYLFHQGTNNKAYEYMGVHCEKNGDSYRYTFRVWAPNALLITLNSDFTDWNNGLPLKRITEQGIWEAVVESNESLDGKFYKYAVKGQNGITCMKADPYAFYSETLGKTASIIYDINSYVWNDADWMKKRMSTVCPKQRGFKPKVNHFYSAPLNIYEIHLASWRKPDSELGEDDPKFLNYREIADRLAPYMADMGYTHVQLMPIMEYPFDASLGYQICGYYAPTSRYGTPDDFKYFIDKMHSFGIGVILDCGSTYFPKDEHGLFEFDGQPLYEYQESAKSENLAWGTRNFDVGRPEVQSFLISNAVFWLREYHADGLKMGSATSKSGDDTECEVVEFLKKLNSTVHKEIPDALMIAEDLASQYKMTKAVVDDGVGFSFSWNKGWIDAVLEYVKTDPVERKFIHEKMTLPLMREFTENHILPISHDDVTGGKKSLVDKCFGEYDDKFACMRTMLLYIMTVPGKKMTFMGNEFAQFREWDYTNELEWFMIQYPRHVEMQRFVSALNKFYRENSELWDIDDSLEGFEWIDSDSSDLNVFSYRRKDKKGREIIVVLNFAPVVRANYSVCVPKIGRYEEVFTTDVYEFGGKNRLNEESVRTRAVVDESGTKKNVIDITLPALGGVIFRKQINTRA